MHLFVLKKGKIINVGSLGTIVEYDVLKHLGADLDMVANKLRLEKLHNELSISNPFGSQPESVLVRLGAFDKQVEPSLKSESIIKLFDFILNSDVYISNIEKYINDEKFCRRIMGEQELIDFSKISSEALAAAQANALPIKVGPCIKAFSIEFERKLLNIFRR